MTKASKILIFFYSLKTKPKAQLELKSFGLYHKKVKSISVFKKNIISYINI